MIIYHNKWSGKKINKWWTGAFPKSDRVSVLALWNLKIFQLVQVPSGGFVLGMA